MTEHLMTAEEYVSWFETVTAIAHLMPGHTLDDLRAIRDSDRTGLALRQPVETVVEARQTVYRLRPWQRRHKGGHREDSGVRVSMCPFCEHGVEPVLPVGVSFDCQDGWHGRGCAPGHSACSCACHGPAPSNPDADLTIWKREREPIAEHLDPAYMCASAHYSNDPDFPYWEALRRFQAGAAFGRLSVTMAEATGWQRWSPGGDVSHMRVHVSTLPTQQQSYPAEPVLSFLLTCCHADDGSITWSVYKHSRNGLLHWVGDGDRDWEIREVPVRIIERFILDGVLRVMLRNAVLEPFERQQVSLPTDDQEYALESQGPSNDEYAAAHEAGVCHECHGHAIDGRCMDGEGQCTRWYSDDYDDPEERAKVARHKAEQVAGLLTTSGLVVAVDPRSTPSFQVEQASEPEPAGHTENLDDFPF